MVYGYPLARSKLTAKDGIKNVERRKTIIAPLQTAAAEYEEQIKLLGFERSLSSVNRSLDGQNERSADKKEKRENLKKSLDIGKQLDKNGNVVPSEKA